ncbi:MAG: hypothetical protein IK116_03190, partial [Firmicutes bacterium]|nr:hypothetical protein [Bacillota bacterium]
KTYSGNAGIGTGNGTSSYTTRVATLTINGGVITVKNVGEGAAGIGSGSNGSGINITINGGTVTTTGGRYGAGIGGGGDLSGDTITINGGKITANGGQYYGAGIGGGNNGAGGTITITGGDITAIANNTGSAGIGGGRQGNAGIITISGGTIHARSKDGGAGIGGGWSGSGGRITISGGEITAVSNGTCAGIGAGQKGSAGSLTLTWTDQSKETMKVYSNKYTGTVSLQRAFWDPKKDETMSYQPGALMDATTPKVSDLNGLTLIPCDTFYVSRWSQLQMLIDSAGTTKTTIVLGDTVTAESFNTRLLITAGQDITLDLKGHTLDRNSTKFEENGYVIQVESGAVLTIQDSRSGGTIKGGKGSSVGAILVDGTLNLKGGSISGNESGGDGGAIVLREHAKMVMTGGAISGNTARASAGAIRSYAGSTADLLGGSITNNTATNYHGGAMYIGGTVTLGNIQITGNYSGFQGGAILQGGTLNIQGSPVIEGHTGVSGNDVYLRPGKIITVTGELNESALIGVYTEKNPLSAPVVLTSGLAGNGTKSNFKYSGRNDDIDPDIVVTLNGDGEAVLGKKAQVKVTLKPGE